MSFQMATLNLVRVHVQKRRMLGVDDGVLRVNLGLVEIAVTQVHLHQPVAELVDALESEKNTLADKISGGSLFDQRRTEWNLLHVKLQGGKRHNRQRQHKRQFAHRRVCAWV